MRLERRFILEQFVEQELRRIVLAAADQEQLGAGVLLRLGQEAVENLRDLVGLSFLGFPLRHDQKARCVDRVADGSCAHRIVLHLSSSVALLDRACDPAQGETPAIVMIAASEPMADRRVSIIVVVVSSERFMIASR